MNRFKAPVVLCLALLPSFSFQSKAQFYAPDTEYHDRVQRVYVVEAARVIGWLANRQETNIGEVTFQVVTKPDESTEWNIHWLDSAGKTLRSVSVGYPSSLLKDGPAFYRSVMTQLRLADWKGLTPVEREEVVPGYWRGAKKMGLSRERGLAEAFKILRNANQPSDAKWAPELAGLLAHADLPATQNALSIDSVLLARGAAWLAACEAACGADLDALWPPLLFQAGREQAACAIWNKNYSATVKTATAQQRGWNIWLRKPVSREVFVFATEPDSLPMAMPMLIYDGAVNQTGSILAGLLEDFAGGAGKLPAFHNYAPFFAVRSSVSGGRLLEGAWPVFWRQDWLGLLSQAPIGKGDFAGYLSALKVATNSFPKNPKPGDYPDISIIGLRETAPLIRMGRQEGTGSLAPVAVATVRDLLNYGWEMSGLQMGSRYRFVAYGWGVPDMADAIIKGTTSEIPGVTPFFLPEAEAHAANYHESLVRLQMVEGLHHLVGYSRPAFDSGGDRAASARLFVKRCWLRPRDFEWQARTYWDAGLIQEIASVAEPFQSQGGPSGSVQVMAYLDGIHQQDLTLVPGGEELKNSIADHLPEPTYLTVMATYYRDLAGKDSFTRGRMVERLYWKNPDSRLEDRVFRDYAVGGAYKSARRFYLEARENIEDPVRFSNDTGKMAFVLAYLLNDEKLRSMTLEDSASGSGADLIMHVWEAALGEDPKELEQKTRDLAERYGDFQNPGNFAGHLLKFLALLPALGDPRHPSRTEALHFFVRDSSWTVLRWIWIQKYHVQTADAVAFLGGEEADLFQLVLVRYLQNDRPRMLDALTRFSRSHSYLDEKDALAYFLYNKLINHKVTGEDQDLRPANVVTIRKAVLAKLNKTAP